MRSLRNKFDELQAYVSNHMIDIIALTETWLTSEITDDEIALSGYNSFRCDRIECRHGGGVILYCKSDLRPMLVNSLKDAGGMEEFLSCRINHTGGYAEIAVIYRSPSSNSELVLKEISRVARNVDCIITGDFNAPNIDWEGLSVTAGGSGFEHDLLFEVMTNSLHQLVKTPTRSIPGQTPHILDLILTHDEQDFTDLKHLDPLSTSDHILLECTWSKRVFIRPVKPRRNVWKTDVEGMQGAAAEIFWPDFDGLDVDELNNLITDNVTRLYERFTPICNRQTLKQRPPWFDHELRKLLKLRRRLWLKFKRSSVSIDYDKYKECRNACTDMKRMKRGIYEQNLADSAKMAPKKLFAYLRRRTKANNGIPPLKCRNTSAVLEDDADKAMALRAQYSSVFAVEDLTDEHLQLMSDRTLSDHVISLPKVKELLLHLNEQSAPGPDELHPRILKCLALYICEPVAALFRKSLDTGKLPTVWKKAIVKPMFKGGSQDDAVNYRPVSLTSVLCKVMERIMKEALEQHFKDAGLWHPAQHGFAKGRSCVTNLLIAKETWAQTVDLGDQLDVAYVDFSKAFDQVPHRRLMVKLAAYGVSGKIWNWILDFVSGRTMRVKVNDAFSEWVECTSGVPQGSVLGPELFKIYINDLAEALPASCLLYADDLKLWARVANEEDVDDFQNALDNLASWSRRWLMPINNSKCGVLPIGGKQPLGVYHLGGYLLKESELERDLGILISPDFKTTEESKRKTRAAFKLLWSIRRAFGNLTPEIFRKLFISHVRPILEYGQPAFHPRTKLECMLLESVQRKGSKAVTGLNNHPYEERLQHLGLFPLEYRRLRGDLIYTWKILRGDLGVELKNFFEVITTNNTRGHQHKLYKTRRLRIDPAITLSTRVTNAWNNLPAEVVSSGSEKEFKQKLDKHLQNSSGDTCSCCVQNTQNLTTRTH